MAIFWRADPLIDAARKAPGWVTFHRECGKLNFYIENIEKRGRGYAASSYRLKDRFKAPYTAFPMEEGVGRTVIDACVDAYRKAVAIGHMADTHLERLFGDDDEDLIGDVPVAVAEMEEDLIG